MIKNGTEKLGMGRSCSILRHHSGRGVKLTTHLHLVPRWGMRGAIPQLPQYAFMAWWSVKSQGELYLYPSWHFPLVTGED
jgi:hypothetical protein